MNISWKHHRWLEGWGKNIWKKSLQGEEGKERFRETNKVHKEIYNVHQIYRQSASEVYFLGLQKDLKSMSTRFVLIT